MRLHLSTAILLASTAIAPSQISFASCLFHTDRDSNLNDALREMSAKEEIAFYINKIENTKHGTDHLPQDPACISRLYNLGRDAAALYNPDQRRSMFMDRCSLKEGRRKATHRLSGITAPVIFDTTNAEIHPFTGFFASGASEALLRFSSAPGIKEGPLTPSISIKLTRNFLGDGHPADGQALNLAVISRLEDEEDNPNTFFSSIFSNNLKQPVGFLKTFVTEFDKTAAEINNDTRTNINPPDAKLSGLYLPPTAFAQTDSSGGRIESFVSPYIVEFRPTPFMANLPNQSLNDDFRLTIMENVPARTVMFEVFAKKQNGHRFYKVFEVVNVDQFVSSDFGNSIAMPHNPGFL